MSGDESARNGPSFYDDPDVFDRYTRARASAGNANENLEGPEIDRLVGDPSGLRVLDLGCGAGAYGRRLLDAGASRYVGIDGSQRMIAAARALLSDTRAEIVQADIASIEPDVGAFDLVVSRLALHYIEDLNRVFRAVRAALVSGGRLVFSVEHPVITSCSRAWTGEGRRQDWIVDDYFTPGARETSWLGSTVIKYHRTLESYWSLLLGNRFAVEHLREGCPQPEHFSDSSEYERRKRIPLFLIIAARTV